MEKNLKAHCNTCLRETNHSLLHEEEQPWSEEVGYNQLIYGAETFNMIKCCGCDSVKLMHNSWFSEMVDESGQPYIETNYYPPAISRAEPKWLSDVLGPLSSTNDVFIVDLFREIYSALHNNSRRLAVMGIRALIEHLMIREVKDNGSFKKNIEAFQDAGYLSKKQRETIEPILEAGHAAIHRGYEPSPEDVLTVVEVTESLVETIYVHSKKASKLKARVPGRTK
ncbi:MAG: DUF4145 domain-containing protein [Marinobacter sp.]|uniref:DUF4145 domain-containing protein n=1 Tax=Marinobacter sp. TaxID=50741 RepID=UPI00329857EF